MKKQEKRKRINQGFGVSISTKTASKVNYKLKEKLVEEYVPQEFVIKIIANNIKDRHRDGETKISKIIIEMI